MAKEVSATLLQGYVEGKLERLRTERDLLKYSVKLFSDNLAAVENEIKQTISQKEVVDERLLGIAASASILEAVKQLKENNKKVDEK